MSAEPVITEMVAICHHEPRGDFGLEGYQRGETYRCQFVVSGNHAMPPYYRVFPESAGDYYECASPRSITKYFQIEEKSS